MTLEESLAAEYYVFILTPISSLNCGAHSKVFTELFYKKNTFTQYNISFWTRESLELDAEKALRLNLLIAGFNNLSVDRKDRLQRAIDIANEAREAAVKPIKQAAPMPRQNDEGKHYISLALSSFLAYTGYYDSHDSAL